MDSAIVLAAGEGRRLRPLTEHRPKPMLPAANRPILEYVLDALVGAGIEDVHLVVGYERDRVRSHFGPTYGDAALTYHVQEKQLGTGHAVLQARNAVDGAFLVVNGDEVLDEGTVSAVVEAHTEPGSATLAVVESNRAPEYGAVRMRGDEVTAFAERPGSGRYRLLNRGVYAFDASFFETVASIPRREGELPLTDAFSGLVADGNVRGVRTDGIWSAVTYPWDLLSVTSDVLSHELVDKPKAGDRVYVDDTARIHEDATLRGPVVVGPDSVVGPQAVVGPDTALGRNVTVGAGSVVERSVFDTGTRTGPNVTLVGTVTGQAVEFEAGVTATGGPADVRVGNTIHEDIDFGCLVADWATVGGGATVEPGVLIGPDTEIQTGTYVSRNVGGNTTVTR